MGLVTFDVVLGYLTFDDDRWDRKFHNYTYIIGTHTAQCVKYLRKGTKLPQTIECKVVRELAVRETVPTASKLQRKFGGDAHVYDFREKYPSLQHDYTARRIIIKAHAVKGTCETLKYSSQEHV